MSSRRVQVLKDEEKNFCKEYIKSRKLLLDITRKIRHGGGNLRTSLRADGLRLEKKKLKNALKTNRATQIKLGVMVDAAIHSDDDDFEAALTRPKAPKRKKSEVGVGAELSVRAGPEFSAAASGSVVESVESEGVSSSDESSTGRSSDSDFVPSQSGEAKRRRIKVADEIDLNAKTGANAEAEVISGAEGLAGAVGLAGTLEVLSVVSVNPSTQSEVDETAGSMLNESFTMTQL
jgi:hypothetical protein